MTPPLCTYCKQPSRLMDGKEIAADLAGQQFWQCDSCEARAGVYPNSNLKPKGRFANKFLRRERSFVLKAHDKAARIIAKRDCITMGHARAKCYGWLAEQMMMSHRDCHVSLFDETQCKKAAEICMEFVNNHSPKVTP